MNKRHRNATTTPEMRRLIQVSDLSVSQLAKQLKVSESTIRKWRKRNSVVDASNTPHHLNTTLSPIEEYVVVGLRHQLKMPLDRLLHVTQTFINPNVSRSGLARCLKRYGISRLEGIRGNSTHYEKHFNQLPVSHDSDAATYTLNTETLATTLALPNQDNTTVVQVESVSIPPKLDEDSSSSVLIGMDPSSGWVYVDIYQDGDTLAANRYMTYVLKYGPFHLRKLLVRNYQTFLQRFPGAGSSHRSNQEKALPEIKTPDVRASSGDS